jgi:hypothetical protein
MKFVWLILLIVISNDPLKVSKINSAKAEAKKAFQSGDYKGAITKYKYLIDSLGVNEDEVMLNLAHAYYLQKDTANAITKYQSLTQSQKPSLASKANLQLGLMANQQGKAEQALSDFKRALKEDPTNEDARYNYEMLKKKLEEKKKQDQQKKDQQNKDQQKQDQQQQNKDEQQKKDQENKEKQEQQKKDQEQKDKEQQQKDQQQKEQEEKEQQEKEQQEQQKKDQENKDKKDQDKKNMNFDKEKMPQMSEEKANMILEAMKNQEKQYLQQNKRKATKSKDRGKPDW